MKEERVAECLMSWGRLFQSNRLHNLNTFSPLPNAQRRQATRITFQEKTIKESRPKYNLLFDLDVFQAVPPVYLSHEKRVRTLRRRKKEEKKKEEEEEV